MVPRRNERRGDTGRERFDTGQRPKQSTKRGAESAPLFHARCYFGGTAPAAGQSVAPATAEGGRGLGLAIVKRIAELHGGDAAVESVLRRGTRVVLTLPAASLPRRDELPAA